MGENAQGWAPLYRAAIPSAANQARQQKEPLSISFAVNGFMVRATTQLVQLLHSSTARVFARGPRDVEIAWVAEGTIRERKLRTGFCLRGLPCEGGGDRSGSGL